MSHAVKIERPEKWDNLDGLSEDAMKSVRFARDVAIDIIENLEPEHISSFPDLVAKIKSHLDGMLRGLDNRKKLLKNS